MEELPPWVRKAAAAKKREGELQRLFFFLLKETSLSWNDLMGMPVPAILGLADELSEFNKEQERQMKKSQRKK